MSQDVIFTVSEKSGHRVAEITLNRPEKGNALTLSMLDQIESAVSAIEGDTSIRAVVLRGNGRHFCTGGDIGAWGNLSPQDMSRTWIARGIAVLNRVAKLPQPVVALISGHAIGGGLELALAADFRVAVTTAKFSTPEVGLGMLAGWGGVRKLAEIIGVARARQMTLLGTPINAEQALTWGLVTSIANDSAALEAAANGLVETLLGNAPVAMAVTKRLLATMHLDLGDEHGAAAESLMETEDCREGVRAFREKRPPVFRNR